MAEPEGAEPRHWRMGQDLAKLYQLRFHTTRPSLIQKLKAWMWHSELWCLAVYRFGQLAQEIKDRSVLLGALPYLVYLAGHFVVRNIFHVEIPPQARIGPAFYLGHAYTIVFGRNVIGSNCSVTHNVTMGWTTSKGKVGIPTLGNNVYVGTGATLLGPIHIGDGATIGPGAVVLRDVPPGALVMGNPARVVSARYDNSTLMGYRMPEQGVEGETVEAAQPAPVLREHG